MTSRSQPLVEALRLLANGHSLSVEQSSAAFGVLVAGDAKQEDAAQLLMGLKSKGETAEEIAGAATSLRGAMVVLEAGDADALVDTCGTGGGRVGTLNISTGAAFVAVGAGARVAKHGNRSHTSRSGSADVLEALGTQIELAPEVAARALAATDFTFMYAPLYHPAMRHVAPVRRRLGVPTIMNQVGPLANPARAGRQVLGAADARVAPLLAEALRRLGTVHSLVVHAEVGMDEISPWGPTHVWEVNGDGIRQWQIRPDEFGLEVADLASLAGGSPAENATRIERLLDGDQRDRAARAALILNAGAALMAAGVESEFGRAAGRARDALDSGRGAEALARFRAAAPVGAAGSG